MLDFFADKTMMAEERQEHGNEQFQRQQLRLIRNNNKKVPGPLQISLREYSELVP
ncbi:2207_t:CDS:2 [Funneliformis geosporum]|uniref:2207_t:CDS:1 n=1 Tax=Funneliformis geosporum TaxID=1117311 RepID=A0A9W4SBM3_9GLOM|nr:2207_t:CDS:2 [Funneliformis geosporum]